MQYNMAVIEYHCHKILSNRSFLSRLQKKFPATPKREMRQKNTQFSQNHSNDFLLLVKLESFTEFRCNKV